jgi:hypothetical protein
LKDAEAIRDMLGQYTGTEHYWRVFPGNESFLITDGVKAMSELCGSFWLVDAIFSWQSRKKVGREGFQVWKLRFFDKERGDEAFLVCEDGNDNKIARQEIDYTDFPLPEGITLYLDGGVLLLPSEY